MVKLSTMIRRPKRIKFSSLTFSIIISISIVYAIHTLFIFPSIGKEINQTKQNLFEQIKAEIKQSDEMIPTVIEKYRSLNTEITITRIPGNSALKLTENQCLIKINKTRYLIYLKSADFINQARLALFGSFLLFFALTFFFTRLISLYIENNTMKEDLSNWEKKLNIISGKINKLEYNLNDALALIQASTPHSYKEWEDVYFKICEFDVLLDLFRHKEDILEKFAKVKANFDYKFTNYYLKHFPLWQKPEEPSPLFLMNVMDNIKAQQFSGPVFFMIFDSMRFDHWLKVKPYFTKILPDYTFDEKIAWSLLPTYTPYCRNSLLAGKSPRECAREAYHGNLFNNQYEELLFHKYLKNHDLTGQYIHNAEIASSYNKLDKSKAQLPQITALIYMFIDGLTHSMNHTKTDESLFREHVLVEFNKTTIINTLELIKAVKGTIVLTSDHGNVLAKQTIRVNQFDITGFDQPGKISHVPERFLTGHARINKISEFKTPNTHLVLDPETFLLPGDKNTNYAFCRGPFKYDTQDQRHIYQYVHGGASIYELLVPYVIIKP